MWVLYHRHSPTNQKHRFKKVSRNWGIQELLLVDSTHVTMYTGSQKELIWHFVVILPDVD